MTQIKVIKNGAAIQAQTQPQSKPLCSCRFCCEARRVKPVADFASVVTATLNRPTPNARREFHGLFVEAKQEGR